MQRPTTAKPFSFDFKLLRTACIALLSAQAPALVATLPLGPHAPAAIAQTQSAEAVAKIAQAITVRIEGATQGSGVLVKREGTRYTVLTAWHVVSGQRAGEELDIITADGQRHQLAQGSIQRLGKVDLAVLTFQSPSSYEVASIGDVKSVSSGSTIFVSGFPLPTSAVPSRLWRFLDGKVIANATVAIPNGYQLLYSNPTLPGMSGGAVLNAQGQLVGIHASAERADKISEKSGKAVATGTNQAVPIKHFNQYESGDAVDASTAQSETADDYLAQAKALLDKNGSEQEVIRLASRVLTTRQSSEAYFYRAYAKYELGDKQGAIADYNQAIAINPEDDVAYYNRAHAKYDLGDVQGAAADYSQAIAINPQIADAYNNRGNAKDDLGDKQGAVADYNQAIADDNLAQAKALLGKKGSEQEVIRLANQVLATRQSAEAYFYRAYAKSDLGDKQGARADFSQAIAKNIYYQDADAYKKRVPRYCLDAIVDLDECPKYDLDDLREATADRLRFREIIEDSSKAIAINPQDAEAYNNRGIAKSGLGNKQEAIADYNKAIAINRKFAEAYHNRGNAKSALGDQQGAIADYNQAIAINPQDADAYYGKYIEPAPMYYDRGNAKYYLGDKQGACSDYKKAASLGSRSTAKWLQSDAVAWCRNMP